MIVLRLRENQRGVRFRLGRVTGVVGPGWVWLLPWLDRLQVVDLDQAILGWRGYSREELERRLLALVLDTSRVGDRRPDSSPASVSKPETRSRATSAGIGWWLFHGLLLALGWLLLFAGGLAIRGKTAPPPLTHQSDYQTGLDIAGGMILLLVGLAVVVRGCRNTRRPTDSPFQVVGATKAISAARSSEAQRPQRCASHPCFLNSSTLSWGSLSTLAMMMPPSMMQDSISAITSRSTGSRGG